MYLGRFILGETVPLLTLALGQGGNRAQPDDPVSFTVYDGGGLRVTSGLSPALDRGRTAGLFHFGLTLGAAYSVGRYMVRTSWDAGGVRQVADCFDIVPGGAAGGLIVSHRYVTRPSGDAIVRKTDAGKRVIGRRPSP